MSAVSDISDDLPKFSASARAASERADLIDTIIGKAILLTLRASDTPALSDLTALVPQVGALSPAEREKVMGYLRILAGVE